MSFLSLGFEGEGEGEGRARVLGEWFVDLWGLVCE
jgi:hypothetical protein